MHDKERISDDELLYRYVRGDLAKGELYSEERGKLEIRPAAFRDPNQQPSVDRAVLRRFDPSLTKSRPTDGVVTLMTGEVRAIGEVKSENQPDDFLHAVDVEYDPLPQNSSHSQIIVNPAFFGEKRKQRNAFKLLRVALARLATINGWTLRPGED